MKIIPFIAVFFIITSLYFGQESSKISSYNKANKIKLEDTSSAAVQIKNSSGEVLLRINAEGSGSSISLPPLDIISSGQNKLYNLDNMLYWNETQIGNPNQSNGWTLINGKIFADEVNSTVGIGTTNPKHKLHIENGGIYVQGNDNYFSGLTIKNNVGRSVLNLQGTTSDSNYRSSQLVLSDLTSGLSWRLVNTNSNRLLFVSYTNGSTFEYPLQIDFSAPTNSLTINEYGNIGIGAWSSEHKLAVAGSIISEEVVVKLQSNWPDYVFSEDYDLTELSEVEKFIKENRHLEDIPPEEEIEKNGIDIAEIQIKLLEKIEELTLYIIEQDKEIKELNTKVSRLSERMEN